jgi:acyl dehydratase
MGRSMEDFAVGERHVSASFLFTEQEIVDFARKYDPQYFHLDPERAVQSHFGGLVAAGCQTLSLAWKLAYDTGLFDDVGMAGIGLDEIRWVRPVYAGDSVRAEFFLIESRPSRSQPDRAIARFGYEMKNQRDEIVMTLTMIQMVRRRAD